jgi:parvulin-like peptidyl-prolyl isomerase
MKTVNTIIAILLLAGTAFGEEVVDSVLAEVNGTIITRYDISLATRDAMEELNKKYNGKVPPQETLQLVRNALWDRVDRILLLEEAQKMLDERVKATIAGQVEDVIKKFIAEAGSLVTFQRQLHERGHTVDSRKKELIEERMIQQLLNEKVRMWVSVSPAEIKAYYQEHRGDFEHPERVKFRQIVIRVSEYEDTDQAYDAAKNVMEKIRAGHDFAALAKTRSHGPLGEEGGLWDFIERGNLLKPIEEAVFSLDVGQVSPIIDMDNAFYIVKVEARQPRRIELFGEVQGKIEVAIREEKYRKALQEYIVKLRKSAQIKIYSQVQD